MKDFTWNKEEMLTALELALAFIVPLWGGLYVIARIWG